MTFEETEKMAYLAIAVVAFVEDNGGDVSDELAMTALSCGEFVKDTYETAEEVNEMLLKTLQNYLDLKEHKDGNEPLYL